ncbi:hypothetical protein [Bacillus sp. OAE603]|uniref:hypothetical protein n=1 Tax=Gottfriedia sp. OAE603 TaxID=2663872 RepID=UPI00178B4F8D
MNELKVYEVIVGKKHEVVLCKNKEIASYWVRDKLGLSKEQMAIIKVLEIPNEKKVTIKDYGEATIKELIELTYQEDRFSKVPRILCWKNPDDDLYECRLSKFELPESE